jgi:hypothetical protein
LQSLYLPR